MCRILSFITFMLCMYYITYGQNQQAIIKIEKSENGETTIIEKKIKLSAGQDINSILKELGVLDELGNLKEGQSFEINLKKLNGLDIDQEIKIEYFDMPEFDFELESKAFLGVMLTELPEKNGVLIQDVIEGSQAEKSGLQRGDILISFNGQKYYSVEELVSSIGVLKPGDSVETVYTRNGELFSEVIELGERKVSPFELKTLPYSDYPNPEEELDENGMRIYEFHMENENLWPGINEEDEKAFLGVSPSYECSVNDEKGVLIGNVTPSSTAQIMGVQPGDRITKLFKDEVSTFEELAYIIKNLNKGDEIKIELLRDGKKLKLKGKLGSRNDQQHHQGFDMFQGFESPPQQGEFFFKYDGEEDSIHLQGLEERLNEMMMDFEMNEDFNSGEFEKEIQEMLTPLVQDLNILTEEISISIYIEPITPEDLTQVNENATEKLKTNDDLLFDFVNFFPNPNNGEFTLRFKLPNSDKFKILIYDQVGKTVYEERRVGESEYKEIINLSVLADGPYFLQIIQSNKTYSRKIIKE